MTDSAALGMIPDFVGLLVMWEHGDEPLEGYVVAQEGPLLFAMDDDGRVYQIPLYASHFLDTDGAKNRVESYRTSVVLAEAYRDSAMNQLLADPALTGAQQDKGDDQGEETDADREDLAAKIKKSTPPGSGWGGGGWN